MQKFNIRVGFWSFVRLSPKNDVICGEAVKICCFAGYTIVKELHGTTETYRS
jgi:hypothetical protein